MDPASAHIKRADLAKNRRISFYKDELVKVQNLYNSRRYKQCIALCDQLQRTEVRMTPPQTVVFEPSKTANYKVPRSMLFIRLSSGFIMPFPTSPLDVWRTISHRTSFGFWTRRKRASVRLWPVFLCPTFRPKQGHTNRVTAHHSATNSPLRVRTNSTSLLVACR